jgi:hypothetical protein
MLQLYYDGMGVTNPLRSHGSLHNIGAFYYTIKNVPEEFNSCFANVHLLALWALAPERISTGRLEPSHF